MTLSRRCVHSAVIARPVRTLVVAIRIPRPFDVFPRIGKRERIATVASLLRNDGVADAPPWGRPCVNPFYRNLSPLAGLASARFAVTFLFLLTQVPPLRLRETAAEPWLPLM